MKEDKERRRIISPIFIEERSDETGSNGKTISGYAAIFDSTYEMWTDYHETIMRGAFDGCDMSDVVCLFNHDDDCLIGRSTNGSGTLKLEIDDKGLKFTVEKPNTTIGNDVAENIRLKNIQGCSFAFTVKEQVIEEVEGNPTLRKITKIGKVYDVGPVVFPAYTETEIEMYKRSIKDKTIKPNQPSEEYFTKLKYKIK